MMVIILEKTILKVEPQNTKHEVIMKYEIGLSQYFINSKFVIYPLLARSNFINLFQIYFIFFRIKLNNNGFSFNTLKEVFLNLKNINWSLIGSPIIAKRFGIVKAEIIKKNIYNINLEKYIWRYCESNLKINILKEIKESSPINETNKNKFLFRISGTIPFYK